MCLRVAMGVGVVLLFPLSCPAQEGAISLEQVRMISCETMRNVRQLLQRNSD